ncbi:ThiF family adenylyltransferase [Arenibacter algicola]|uniref:ThiF family adenylyltransferase n=1 Tax=Arenibacter algicola TaxID=616991 RepID=UPI00068A92B9|nr:ThiF family adenylyltransferase [Arenibacter algicola]
MVNFEVEYPIENDVNSVFKYYDTNSSRANIEFINEKFINQKVAIIGLGGTGAYILDLIAKTKVNEIHIYDGDIFLNHNAFRSPGAASIEVLEKKPKKVDYYKGVYSKMRNNIFGHSYYLIEDNFKELNSMDYVFISIDNNLIRRSLVSYLNSLEIPFIDVGLGVNSVDDCLIGTVRVTTGTKYKNDHFENRIPASNNPNNEYETNIQIAELNSLNAVLAVLKWKKLSGFYQDLENEHHTTYSINNSHLQNEEVIV